MSSHQSNSIHPHLNIPFWNGDTATLLQQMRTTGGLLVVPSGPNLTDSRHDSVYKKALRTADYVVMDSGFLALILRAKGAKPTELTRISGFQILEVLLNHPEGSKNSVLNNDKTLWVVPSADGEARIRNYLQTKNFDLKNHQFYLAPIYENTQNEAIPDEKLLSLIQKQTPNWVVLCVAGGKQEKLGLWLRNELREKLAASSKELEAHKIPAMLCTGAAIAFLTGGQANIPKWVDRLYLGWLARIVQSPSKYFYRYFQAFRLPFVLKSWNDEKS